MHVNKDRAQVSNGHQTLTFDRLIFTGTSQLYAMKIFPEGTPAEVINVSADLPKKLQTADTAKNNEKDAS